MAGLALVLQLLSKKQQLSSSTVHSCGSLSACSAAAAAASGYDLQLRQAFLRDFVAPVAYCEESRVLDARFEEWRSDVYRNAVPKSYCVCLKPVFSAFSPTALGLTVSRALVLNFQPVIEQALASRHDDEDSIEEEEAPPSQPVDIKAALKGSGRSAVREVTIVTTRRLLERLVLQNVSRRTSWKLLKDLPRSAERKAGRHLPRLELFLAVKSTTFRGHAVAICASWFVQLILDVFGCIHNVNCRRKHLPADNIANPYDIAMEELTILTRRITGNTLKSGSALALASVGAGVGAVILRPALGQWIGCMVGETAGFIGMDCLIDQWIVYGKRDLY